MKKFKFKNKEGKLYICKFNNISSAKDFAKLFNIKFIGEVK